METPNPFWSEAVQDEFRRLQAERVTTIPREVDDEVREPDYGYDTGIAEEGLQPGNEAQGDLRPNQEEAQVLEQQSPGHRSNTGLSDISAMERGGLKRLETLGLAEVDDTELIPDYNKAPPATTPAPSAEAFPDLTDMLRTLLSGQQALADRLEKLESSKGSTSGASSSAPESRPHAVMPDQPARMVEEASGRAAPKSVKVEMGGELSHRGPPETQVPSQTPLDGMVEIEGAKYAWRVTPEGLQLVKVQEAPGVRPARAASVAEVIHPRARSPFEPTTPKNPKRGREPRTRSESPQKSRQPVTAPFAQDGDMARLDFQGLDAFIQAQRNSPGQPPPLPEFLRKTAAKASSGRGRGSPARRALTPVRIVKYENQEDNTTAAASQPKAAAKVKAEAGGDTELEPEEPVKYVPELPKLEKYDPTTSSIAAGGWLFSLGPTMSSLSKNASVWWKDVVHDAQSLYGQWLLAGPLERIRLKPETLVGKHETGQFSRVEQKAIPLLLQSIGNELREEVIATRQTSVAAILYKTMCKYQPGGAVEREQLLNYLTAPEPAASAQVAVKAVRKWRRWLLRASEVGLFPPDPTLQVRGLDRLHPPTLSASSVFRLQTFRTQNLLDQVPTQEVVNQYSELLLAECEATALAEPTKKTKVAKVDWPGTGKGGKGEKELWKHWSTAQGCKFTTNCKYQHPPIPKGSRRCFSCGGTGHVKTNCPHVKPIETAKGEGKAGKDKGKGAGKDAKKADEATASAAATVGASTVSATSGEGQLGPSQVQMMQEATQLLRSLQLKALDSAAHVKLQAREKLESDQAVRGDTPSIVQKAGRSNSGEQGLIDSGASACLRPKLPNEDLSKLAKHEVLLASGSTWLWITALGTLVSDQETEPIVSLGKLVELGCRLVWGSVQCTLIHPRRGSITVDTSSGCPRITSELAYQLIDDIEKHAMIECYKGLCAKSLEAQSEGLSDVALLDHVLYEVRVGGDVGSALRVFGNRVWSGSSQEVRDGVAAWPEEANAAMCWNRRFRRKVSRSSKVVISLFAGGARKGIEQAVGASGGVCVSVDWKEDLMNPLTYRYLVELASSGRVVAVIADSLEAPQTGSLGGPKTKTLGAEGLKTGDQTGALSKTATT